MNREIAELAIKHTGGTEISGALVLGIIEVESGGDRYAARNEQNYRWTVPQAKRPAVCTQGTEVVFQKTSWGLMQVMGAVAREHGFTGWLPELTDPDTNVAMGVKHLVKLKNRFGEKHGMDGTIAAYNAGSPRFGTAGKFVNQAYVEKVKQAAAKYEAQIAELTQEKEQEKPPKGKAPRTRTEAPQVASNGEEDTK